MIIITLRKSSGGRKPDCPGARMLAMSLVATPGEEKPIEPVIQALLSSLLKDQNIFFQTSTYIMI